MQGDRDFVREEVAFGLNHLDGAGLFAPEMALLQKADTNAPRGLRLRGAHGSGWPRWCAHFSGNAIQFSGGYAEGPPCAISLPVIEGDLS